MHVPVRYVLLVCAVLVLMTLYQVSMLHVPADAFRRHMQHTTAESMNAIIKPVVAGDGITDIPGMAIADQRLSTTTADTHRCRDAMFLGISDGDYTQQCHALCGSSSAVLHVTETDEHYSDGVRLHAGYWCVRAGGPAASTCNPHTGMLVMSRGSTTCVSRFPDMFGGEGASRIVACSDSRHPGTHSTLWDNLHGRAVNPHTLQATSSDERLEDGTYRFTCHFGKDSMNNPYIPHPANRFHPIRDMCKSTVHAAHPDVRTVGLTINNDQWHCDCGDYEETRVSHKHPNDSQSTCTSCTYKWTPSTDKLQIPFACYNAASDSVDAQRTQPCPTHLWERGALASRCSTVTLAVQADPNGSRLGFAPIELNMQDLALNKPVW